MGIITTAGRLLLNRAFPSDLRNFDKVYDKKELFKNLNEVANKFPNLYKDTLTRIKDVGQRASYVKGSTLKLEDFESPFDQQKVLEKEISSIPANASDQVIIDKFADIQNKIEKKTLEEALKKNNTLARQVLSGARGNISQLASTLTTPMLYADNAGRPIRIPIKHSFSEGLDPVEYWASSYGTRKGVISTKFATPEGGYFGKQIGYVSGNLVVTEDDCNTKNGLSTNVDDTENIGRLLALPSNGYPAGTIITAQILSDLKNKNIKSFIIRSPLTCEADSGVCKKCRGFIENGRFPNLGDNVGANSSAALSESATQAAMNVKHTGGQVASAKKKGLELITQLLKVPKVFRGGAVVAETDGKVENIEKAPQGGYYIIVAGEKFYSLPEYSPIVKVGDFVEAGQALTSGIVNPSDVTRLRGMGEGRKMLFESLRNAYVDDGQKVNKVHMESLARNMLSFMKVKDNKFLDDSIPGDILTISNMQKFYNPKYESVSPDKALNKYLAKPVLHYTAGTQLKPSMIQFLNNNNINKIDVTDEEPPFDPVMIRLDDVPAYKDNWLARLYSSHIKQKLLSSTQQSEKAKIHSTEFIPSYITGKDFQTDKVEY